MPGFLGHAGVHGNEVTEYVAKLDLNQKCMVLNVLLQPR